MLTRFNRKALARWTALLLIVGFCCAGYVRAEEKSLSAEDELQAILQRVEDASADARTLSADLVYTVTSAKQQQMVLGKIQLMKPNYARLTYSYMAQPAFPNLVASDGDKVYSFTPSSFQANRTFAPGPFDSILGAKQASGLAPGGGQFDERSSDAKGGSIVLWDAAPVQAFFDPVNAIYGQLYARDLSDLVAEGPVEIDGVTYDVLYHHFIPGNIAGGESSSFHQRLYVAPDGLVHMYVLEFQSAGAAGTQVARLKNVKLNEPMDAKDFVFAPVADEPADD